MKKDNEIIVHKLGRELEYINLYPLGDLHIGSDEFDDKRWSKWKSTVLNDPYGYILIIGDLLDNGLKNSKTNSYEQKLRPSEQKSKLANELRPLKDKILGICRGNHEYRSVLASDDCPLYDVAVKLDKEDLYRENMAFIKISLGEKNKLRQVAYSVVLAHGNSRNKTNNFSYAIDGMDVMVTGHTHQPESTFPAKIVIDMHNEIIREVDFTRIVVPSFLKTGGYGLKGMYMPMGFKIPVVRLDGRQKEVQICWQ